jgi:D-alanine-D-alanine ligase
MAKLKIAVLYGGRSGEHEVSIHSAAAVARALSTKYEVLKILITKQGLWFLQDEGPAPAGGRPLTPVIMPDANLQTFDGLKLKADVFFPVLHGATGEDGCIQGLFEILGAPYAGCGVLTSALGMDKELCKLLASFAGVPIAPYIKLEASAGYKDGELEAAVLKLGYPLFVKPVSLGSSIGVSRVEGPKHLKGALAKAFRYEDTVLIEKGIVNAREIFCGIVGCGDSIHTSLCGELKMLNSEFFDYKAKYEDPDGCDMIIPAAVPQAAQDKMRAAAHDVFRALRGQGLARADFLMDGGGKFYFSEINTMPGMSDTSLFPNLWRSSKKTYEDILDILIHLALKRAQTRGAYSLER